MRVETDAQRVDLLGYGVERTSGLDSELERLQQNRVERAAEIVGRVEERLGVDLDIELRAGIGRPHIAAAIAESEASYDYGDAFADLIGDGGPCYVARDVTGVDSGLELLTESCRVVGLAHPLRYDDPDSALRLAPRLDAVERYYPYERAVDESSVVAAVEDHDLLVTGGSDAHGTTLGAAGLSEHQFEPLRNRFDRTESAAE